MDLYRFFDADDRLLYIGISLSAVQRAAGHRHRQPWWDDVARMDVEHFPDVTRDEILRIEREAIRTERPLHNVVHAVRFSIPSCRVCGLAVRPNAWAYVVVPGVARQPCHADCHFGNGSTPATCAFGEFPCESFARRVAVDAIANGLDCWVVHGSHGVSFPLDAIVGDLHLVIHDLHNEGRA
jgi:hypothetical protein